MSRRLTHTRTHSSDALSQRARSAGCSAQLSQHVCTHTGTGSLCCSLTSLSRSLCQHCRLPFVLYFVFYILSSPFVLFLLPIFAHFAWFARFAFMLHTDTHSHTHMHVRILCFGIRLLSHLRFVFSFCCCCRKLAARKARQKKTTKNWTARVADYNDTSRYSLFKFDTGKVKLANLQQKRQLNWAAATETATVTAMASATLRCAALTVATDRPTGLTTAKQHVHTHTGHVCLHVCVCLF